MTDINGWSYRMSGLSRRSLVLAAIGIVALPFLCDPPIAGVRASLVIAASLLAFGVGFRRGLHGGGEVTTSERWSAGAGAAAAIVAVLLGRFSDVSWAAALVVGALMFSGMTAGRMGRREGVWSWHVAATAAGAAWMSSPYGLMARVAVVILAVAVGAMVRRTFQRTDGGIEVGYAPSIHPEARASRRVWSFLAATAVAAVIGGVGFGMMGVARARQEAREVREGRALTTNFWPRTSFRETGASPVSLTLAEGTVHLGPHSRWATGLPYPLNRQFATLDGRATIEINGFGMRVVTATADAQLERGRYEITSLPGSGVTSIRVVAGSAAVAAVAGTSSARRQVGAGTEVLMRADGLVSQTAAR